LFSRDEHYHEAASELELCADEWWSAAALGSHMTGGAPRIFHRRRRRRGFVIGGVGRAQLWSELHTLVILYE